MVLGYFLVRPIPLPSVKEHGREHVHVHAAANSAGVNDDEGQRLLDSEGGGDGDSDGNRIEDPDAL